MRRKYKLTKSKEDVKIEKNTDLSKSNQPISKPGNDEKKDNTTKFYTLNSSKRNIITYNSKFRKFHRFKKEEINKIDNTTNIKQNNIFDNKENKKEKDKAVENKNFKFSKRKIDFLKFNESNLTNKFNEKIINTEPNTNNSISNELEANKMDIRAKYRRRHLNFFNINNDGKYKETKKNKENEEKLKVSGLTEKENKIKINNSQVKNSNLNLENKDNFDYTRNESCKILSLIKKCKKSSMYNLPNKKKKKLIIEINNNNLNENDKEKISLPNTEKKEENFLDFKPTSTIDSRNRKKSIYNFLIHQAHENSNLSNTFNKMYESYMSITNKKRKKKEEIKKYLTMEENETESGNNETNKNRLSINDNNSFNSLSNLIKEYGHEIRKSDINFMTFNIPFFKEKGKVRKLNLRNLLENSPQSKENNTNTDNNSKLSEGINVTNKIVNNNTFNTTYNIYKINTTITKREMPSNFKDKIKYSDLNHQTILNSSSNRNKYFKIFINRNDIRKDEKNKKTKISVHQRVDSLIKKQSKNYKEILINQEKINSNYINMENIYILESNNKSLLNRINNYEVSYNECNDWITYFFDNNIYDLIINIFKNKRNINNIINKIKIEILCYFLCYDASFSKTFSQAGILLKTIFHLLHNNSLLLINYIINNITTNDDLDYNNSLINILNKIINKELKLNLSLQEIHNENCIIEIIEQNYKQINNYYKMIIDNLYNYSINTSTNTSPNNTFEDMNNNRVYKFPQCLSLDLDKINNSQKIKIISLFFFDAYKLLNNYNILDLKIFYDLFLNKKNNIKTESKKFDNIKRYINYHKNKYRNENYNILSNIKFHNDSKNCLYPIKLYYKYTLMINLDILVYFNEWMNIYNSGKNNKVILRPGTSQFLQEMKQIYELIIFANNSFEYISKILKSFENNEKFFEYILSNNQLNFEKNGSISNLDCLNRDLKNIIILDKQQSISKLNKDNIIYVKPFYGDVNNDGNILNKLGEILINIKYDMEEVDDIRISLIKHKFDIITTITTNLN